MSSNLDLYIKKPVDMKQLFEFFGSSYSGETLKSDIYNCISSYLMAVDINLSVSARNESSKRLTKYDVDGVWTASLDLDLYSKTTARLRGVMALAIAKFIYNKFESETFCDGDGAYDFFYGKNGLMIGETSLFISGSYPFPYLMDKRAYAEYHFSHLSALAPTLKNSDCLAKETFDFVIHVSPNVTNEDAVEYFKSCGTNNKKQDYPTSLQLPEINQYVSGGFFIGPIKAIIQHNCWSYHLPVSEKPIISVAFSTPTEWIDALICYIVYILQPDFLNVGSHMVTTGTGEVIFICKNKECFISEEWKSYFSKHPLSVDSYTIDKDFDDWYYLMYPYKSRT